MNQDELNAVLVNNLEVLNKKLDQLTEALRKNAEAMVNSANSSKELKETVGESNKVFNQVQQGVKELYAKVQQIEMVAKLAKQFGPMLGGLGGLGNPTPKK